MIKVFVSGLFIIMLFYPIAHLFWTFVLVKLEGLEKEIKNGKIIVNANTPKTLKFTQTSRLK